MEFIKSTISVTGIIKTIINMLEYGYEGPVDFDETNKGFVTEDHIVFVVQVYDYQKSVSEFYGNLFSYISNKINKQEC